MNKTVKIVLVILVVIFIVIPALAWFLFKSDPDSTVYETEVVEEVVEFEDTESKDTEKKLTEAGGTGINDDASMAVPADAN